MTSLPGPRCLLPARTTPLLAALALLSWAAPALAHDFWVQPARFQIAPGTRAPFTIEVGHGPARQRSPIQRDRVVAFQSIGPGSRENQLPALHLGGASDAEIVFRQPGVHIVAFATNYAASNLPALRYNDYLKAEGLTAVIRQRQASGATEEPGRELYCRRAKALVQVGPRTAGPQPHVTRPIGLSLEIVPLRDPYARSAAPGFPVQVLYGGKPLGGALVKLTDLRADAAPVETHLTDGNGRAVFRSRHEGQWQMNVVWSESAANTRRADFVTTFSSLTFGFPSGPAS